VIGTTLAHYRITAALGAGGMGEVWRATDTKLGREVALKVLPEAFAADPDRLARFQREAKVLASLNHPNIAHLYGLESVVAQPVIPSGSTSPSPVIPSGSTSPSPLIPSGSTSPPSVIPSDSTFSSSVIPSERSEPRDLGGGSGQRYSGSHPPDSSTPASPGDAFVRNDRSVVHFLVMELVEGEDLTERISRGHVPVDEALPIALQIADALEAAHEVGIVHRDLKPANVKIRPDGTVKVLDFGLAKAWETDTDATNLSMSPTLTRSRACGTRIPAWPRTARNTPSLDAKWRSTVCRVTPAFVATSSSVTSLK